MKKRAVIYVAFFFVVVLLSACGGGEQEENVRLKRARPIKKVVEKVDKNPGKVIVDSSIALKRNPFKSYLAETEVEGVKRVRTPLECCDLRSFRILAIISGIEDARVLVLSPDGKRHEVRRGNLIGAREGRVYAITAKGLIVDELVKDELTGKKVRTRVELRLSGGGKGKNN
ncbi:hypothetical protein MNBD_DELTA01-1670 [hydrothermal vent metagenome]|uniref:Type IV pilus biogenesis protein PilP n=1 Tax=hydrothermal vent metagenome TaxID=652676 RepID=A0A3B0RD85_9ZZZZ